MTAEIGLFLLILALCLAIVQAAFLLPVPSLQTYLRRLMPTASWLQALLVVSAFFILMLLRLNSDFSVINVAEHSNIALPLLYKIAGTWGNHEGSMLLWIGVLSCFGLTLGITAKNEETTPYAVATQALLSAGTLAFVIFTSNPFERQFPPPVDGAMLNPLLQDIGLALHPPLLYLGYVGFSMVFSLAVAVLLQPKSQDHFANGIHPWIMLSWSALTLGIGLGSWWAYRELGWGGWWFWDPVENASLLPWLAGTALLHANIVLKKRGALFSWVLLLSIITFGLSLIGTFLVRSGALTSVHSFASDPTRGVFILCFIALTIGSALLLYTLRMPTSEDETPPRPLSREGVIVINNMFVLTACASVLLGTIYPLIAEWMNGEKLSVGAPYFNLTFIPLMALPLFFAGLAPFMPWKNASLKVAFRRSRPALFATLAACFLVFAYAKNEQAFALLGFGLAAWLAASSLWWLWQADGVRNRFSVCIGHLGVAVLLVGITGVSLWKEQKEAALAPNDIIEIAGYRLEYRAQTVLDTPNYQAMRAEFSVMHPAGKMLATLAPEHRRYRIQKTATSEAALYSTWLYDIYIVVGETLPDGKHVAVRAYVVPLVGFIWAGFVLIALGGLLALRRKS